MRRYKQKDFNDPATFHKLKNQRVAAFPMNEKLVREAVKLSNARLRQEAENQLSRRYDINPLCKFKRTSADNCTTTVFTALGPSSQYVHLAGKKIVTYHHDVSPLTKLANAIKSLFTGTEYRYH